MRGLQLRRRRRGRAAAACCGSGPGRRPGGAPRRRDVVLVAREPSARLVSVARELTAAAGPPGGLRVSAVLLGEDGDGAAGGRGAELAGVERVAAGPRALRRLLDTGRWPAAGGAAAAGEFDPDGVLACLDGNPVAALLLAWRLGLRSAFVPGFWTLAAAWALRAVVTAVLGRRKAPAERRRTPINGVGTTAGHDAAGRVLGLLEEARPPGALGKLDAWATEVLHCDVCSSNLQDGVALTGPREQHLQSSFGY